MVELDAVPSVRLQLVVLDGPSVAPDEAKTVPVGPKRGVPQAGIVGMLFHKLERNPKNKGESFLGFFYNLLNSNDFRDSIAREAELAAAEPLAVITQPGVGIEVLGIKHRHPILILKSACSNEDHTDKIGEEMVKIKKNTVTSSQ